MKLIVLRNQEQFGPFDLDQIQFLVNEGHFQLTDYCWEEGWSDWRLLSSLVNRIPATLQNAIPTPIESIPEVSPGELLADSHYSDLNCLQIIPTDITSHSQNYLDNSALRPGMIVKNESQSVSCDFITSLAVRGVYVTPKPKPEATLHLARGTEHIGCFTLTDISIHLESGDLLATDLFWKESTGAWMELSQIT